MAPPRINVKATPRVCPLISEADVAALELKLFRRSWPRGPRLSRLEICRQRCRLLQSTPRALPALNLTQIKQIRADECSQTSADIGDCRHIGARHEQRRHYGDDWRDKRGNGNSNSGYRLRQQIAGEGDNQGGDGSGTFDLQLSLREASKELAAIRTRDRVRLTGTAMPSMKRVTYHR